MNVQARSLVLYRNYIMMTNKMPKTSKSMSKVWVGNKPQPTPFYNYVKKQTVYRWEPDKVYDMPRKAKRN